MVSRLQPVVLDICAVILASLDVVLVVPQQAQLYSNILSGIACLALVLRRRFPFLVMVATIPGFLLGWSQIAAMIALGTVAYRYRKRWPTLVSAAGAWSCRFMIWPIGSFLGESWREHFLDAIYGIVVAGMPIAIGLFAAAREELAARIAELDASRERERALVTRAVRADERAKIAREMHDVVSHQVTLIAMQAGVMQVGGAEPKQIAGTIRDLCARTLNELRGLVGILRTAPETGDAGRRGLRALTELAEESAVSITVEPSLLDVQLPAAVSVAAYRTVQEALTNAHKHAPGADITVRISSCTDELWIEVRNGPAVRSPAELPSGGHGLLGLRERAALLGGTLHARPSPPGGFLVRATFPLSMRPVAGS
ncbi:MAG: sensor histidine kinase [Sciscionella sp.]